MATALPADRSWMRRTFAAFGKKNHEQLRAGFRLADCYEATNGTGLLHEYGVPTFWATYAIKEVK